MAGIENRRYFRMPFFCRVGLSIGDAAPIETSTFDISLGGVGLVSPRIVPKGQAVSLSFRLRGPKDEVVEKVAGRVAHVRSDIDGHFLGIEFLQPLVEARTPVLVRRIERQ